MAVFTRTHQSTILYHLSKKLWWTSCERLIYIYYIILIYIHTYILIYVRILKYIICQNVFKVSWECVCVYLIRIIECQAIYNHLLLIWLLIWKKCWLIEDRSDESDCYCCWLMCVNWLWAHWCEYFIRWYFCIINPISNLISILQAHLHLQSSSSMLVLTKPNDWLNSSCLPHVPLPIPLPLHRFDQTRFELPVIHLSIHHHQRQAGWLPHSQSEFNRAKATTALPAHGHINISFPSPTLIKKMY